MEVAPVNTALGINIVKVKLIPQTRIADITANKALAIRVVGQPLAPLNYCTVVFILRIKSNAHGRQLPFMHS